MLCAGNGRQKHCRTGYAVHYRLSMRINKGEARQWIMSNSCRSSTRWDMRLSVRGSRTFDSKKHVLLDHHISIPQKRKYNFNSTTRSAMSIIFFKISSAVLKQYRTVMPLINSLPTKHNAAAQTIRCCTPKKSISLILSLLSRSASSTNASSSARLDWNQCFSSCFSA